MQCIVHIYLLPFAVLKKVKCGSFLVSAKLKVMVCVYVYVFFFVRSTLDHTKI